MSYQYQVPKKSDSEGEARIPIVVADEHGEKRIEVFEGYRLWDAMLDAKCDFWKLCGGDGVCGTCRVEVLEGAENLSPKVILERQGKEHTSFWVIPAGVVAFFVDWVFWRIGHGLFGGRPKNQRLACQAYVNGPVRVAWKKNTFQRVIEVLSESPGWIKGKLPGRNKRKESAV